MTVLSQPLKWIRYPVKMVNSNFPERIRIKGLLMYGPMKENESKTLLIRI